jgi:hypothetical protein
MRRLILTLGLIVPAVLSLPAQGVTTYSFTHIVEDGDGPSQLANGATGEAQLTVSVSDAGGNQILFEFSNAGAAPSSITDVYFDDGTLLGIAGLIDFDDGTGGDAGVDFTQDDIDPVSPPDLPGGENLSPAFDVTAYFLADSDSPHTILNGVNPGESLGVLFSLQGGGTLQDVLDELATGELRIGIHVQGFADGGSEAFVNNGIVPIPSSLVLGSIGVALIGWFRRRGA